MISLFNNKVVKKHSCTAVRISSRIQNVREADLALISHGSDKGTPTRHAQIHVELEQTDGDEIDLS